MKIKVDIPGVPKDRDITITGLGALPNGRTTEVDDRQVARFEKLRGEPLREALKRARGVRVVTTAKKKEGEE